MAQMLLPIPELLYIPCHQAGEGESSITWKDDERNLKRLIEAQPVNPAPVLPCVLQGKAPHGHGHRELSGVVSDGHHAPCHLLVLICVDSVSAEGQHDATLPAKVLPVSLQLLLIGTLQGHGVTFKSTDLLWALQGFVT